MAKPNGGEYMSEKEAVQKGYKLRVASLMIDSLRFFGAANMSTAASPLLAQQPLHQAGMRSVGATAKSLALSSLFVHSLGIIFSSEIRGKIVPTPSNLLL
jgi:hypothetical protein